MNFKYFSLVFAVGIFALTVDGWASEGARGFQIRNTFKVEYDDNIDEVDTDETSSAKIINELEFVVRFDLENTYVGLRYQPRFTWWDNRAGDSTDLHHEFDVTLRQAFTPRVALDLNNRFRFAERSEAIEDEVVVRERGDFYFNNLGGTLSYQFVPGNVVQARAGYELIRYDDDDVADRSDYDKYRGGASFRHQLQPQIWVSADLDIKNIDYKGSDNQRGSDMTQLGAGLEYLLSPLSVLNVSAGYQYRDFDSSELSSVSKPFFNAGLTWGVSPDTRLTVGASYTFDDANIFPYAGQEQTRIYAGVGHDLTAKISLNVGASYTRSDYDADEAVRAELLELGAREELEDGSEDFIRFSVDASYRINRNNWITADWQFTSLDSDLRRDFDRNRLGLGWRTQF